MSNQAIPRPYINPYIGGILLGLVLFCAFFLTGAGLGASGAINRIQVAFIDLFFSDHVDKVSYLSQYAGGDKNPLDSGSIFMFIGTFLGGMISGIAHRRFKKEIRKGSSISNKVRLFMAFFGGTVMGLGARISRGCTSGQALSGGAVLSLGSWAFMFSVFAGGYAFAYFVRKYWN